MLMATLDYNAQQGAAVGSSAVAAGRAEIWGKFLDIALEYPLFGVPQGAVVDMGEYGFAVIGGDYTASQGAGGTGHNVVLDLAAGRGFPTAALFIVGFAAPIVLLVRRRGLLYAFPFVIAHVMVFLPFMNLSIANWKTFWALHVITAMAALASTTAGGRARPVQTGRYQQ
jgi:O-antigen ligase